MAFVFTVELTILNACGKVHIDLQPFGAVVFVSMQKQSQSLKSVIGVVEQKVFIKSCPYTVNYIIPPPISPN